ncbi:MAG: glycosyltransferase [Ignavibacteriae bacterium]|nr:glycosyltransferase [Ignavibacteriota bacterium]
MNILYISSKKRWGGVVNWMAKTAVALEKRGHSIFIISHPNSKFTRKSNPELKIIEKKLGPLFNPIMILYIVRFIKENKIDLLVTNIDKEVGVGGIAAKICGIPNIRRVGREDDLSHKFRLKWTHKLLVSKCIVPCNFISDEVSEKYEWLDKNDFQTIYTGKNIPNISEKEKIDLKKKLNILENEKVIGITCQLTKIKYVQNLIYAFSSLSKTERDIKLVITGEGNQKKLLIELSKKLNIEEKIVFAGFTDNVFLFASIYDIATLVSKVEGFPNSIVEYLAVGKAVVVTNVGGTSEIVTDNENGFLVPFDDEKTLIEKIKILLDNSDKRKEFEEKAIETIENGFTEDKMIDNLEEFFEENIK